MIEIGPNLMAALMVLGMYLFLAAFVWFVERPKK